MIEGKYQLSGVLEAALQDVINTFPSEITHRGIGKNLYNYRYVLTRLWPLVSHEESEPWILLDVGSGAGVIPLVLKTILRQKMDCLCIDTWEEYSESLDNQMGSAIDMLARLRGASIETKDCDLERNGLPDERSVSICTLLDVIEHLLYPKKILENINGILRPRGYLIITTPNGSHLKGRLVHLMGRSAWPDSIEQWYRGPFWGHYREFTVSEMCQMLTWSGFRVLRIETSNAPHLWTRSKDGSYMPGVSYKSRDCLLKLGYFAVTTLFPSLRYGMLAIAQKT